jgi:hypothetical protein
LTNNARAPGVGFFGKVRIATRGHVKAINTGKAIAKRVGGRLHIGLSGTSHPLTPEQKKTHAEAMFGHPVESGSDHTKNIFSFLSHLHQHHDEVHLVAGSDRASEYRKLLDDWNGKPDKQGRVAFNFKKYTVHEVEGQRGEVDKHPTKMNDDELDRSVSATKLEGLARDRDYDGFKAYHKGLSEKHVKNVYNQIRTGLRAPKSVSAVKKKLTEEINHKQFGPMLDSFVSFASEKLGIKSMPNMKLSKDEMETTFGGYNPAEKSILVVSKNRHPMDIFRTVAHELVHHKQNEDGRLGKDIEKEGATGSDIENEANSEAGKIMRWFARSNPDMFKSKYVTEETHLTEGLNDGNLNVVFTGGGPGSGKSHIASRALSGHGAVTINSDEAFEHIMKRRGLDPMMPPKEEFDRNIARGDAKRVTKEKERLNLIGRNNLIIDGTADDPEKIAKIKAHLEGLGYSSKMMFVNTSDDVSKQRNLQRGKSGGRKVPDGTDADGREDGSVDIRGEKWQAAQKSKEQLRKMFGDEHYTEIDNSEDYFSVTPERRAEIDAEHTRLHNHYRQHFSKPTETEAGKQWIEAEKKRRGITNYRPARATTVSQRPNNPRPATPQPAPQEKYVPNASELEQAKRLGVNHIGNGQFGRGKEQPTHISKNGQLVMAEEKYKKIKACWKGYQAVGFKKKNGKRVPNCVPVDEAFEDFINENTPSQREFGTSSLTKIYKKDTPGEKMMKKKLAKEDARGIPPGGLPIGDGVGPMTTQYRPMTAVGYAITESVQKWASKPEIRERFARKYGNLAEQKLQEAVEKLSQTELYEMKKTSDKKSVRKLKEAWEARGGRDMGTIAKQGVEDVSEQSFNSSFAAARALGKEKFDWRGKSYSTLRKGETSLPKPKAEEPKQADKPEPKVEKPAEPMSRGPRTPEMVSKPDERNRMSNADQQDFDVKKVKSATDAAVAHIKRKDDPVIKRMKDKEPDMHKALTAPSSNADLFKGSRYDDGVNEDWQDVNRKDKTDGLSQKAVNAYRRENPGSKLQTAVTEKKPTGKRAKRRLSFCRRMSGMKKRLTSAETARDPDSRINKALRRWNCEE